MSWATLRTQLYNLLENNKETLGLQVVSSTPKLGFNGYPAADVSPVGNESQFSTTSENKRVYGWSVRLFYETGAGGLEDAIPALETLTDKVIDVLEQENNEVAGRIVGVGMPSRYTFIRIEATPGEWFKTENEELLFVELRVRVVVSVDIT